MNSRERILIFHCSAAIARSLANVLTALTSKKAVWRWTDREQLAFDTIKQRLADATALRIPDHRKPYVVATDASIYGLGGVLMQRGATGLYPIAFYSKQTSREQKKWSQYKLELKAIQICYKKWRHYPDSLPSIWYFTRHLHTLSLALNSNLSHLMTKASRSLLLNSQPSTSHFDIMS